MENKKLLISCLLITTLFLAGCQIYDYGTDFGDEEDEITGEGIIDISEEIDEIDEIEEIDEEPELEEITEIFEEPKVEEITEIFKEPKVEEIKEETKEAQIVVEEGEVVSLNVKAKDSDKDKLTYAFTEPLDDDGKWQTGIGDAGSYTVTVTVSDGESTISQDVTILVTEANKAPELKPIKDITVTAGDKVILDPEATDPDGDDITFKFSGWMDEETYRTTEDDEGTHKVTITATDEKGATDKITVRVTVEIGNRPPKLAPIDDIEVEEGDTITLKPKATDPDGDKISIKVSGWMDKLTYETDFNDEGTHEVTITATDTEGNKDSIDIEITVENVNRPPVILEITQG